MGHRLMPKVLQYGDELRKAQMGMVSPIPRNLIPQLTNDELADEIQRLYALRKAQQSARILLDMRLLRWFDPEKLQDQWQNVWTGAPLSKLYHSGGLAVEIFNWTKPVVESLVGLLAGYKPQPYSIKVPPEDPATDASILHSDIVNQLYNRQLTEINYWPTFTDHVGNIVSLGRSWKGVYWNPSSMRPEVTIHWPGFVSGFWQADRRTLEQVIVSLELTAGEAVDLYPEFEDAILSSLQTPDSVYGQSSGASSNASSQYRHVQLLTFWYRSSKGTLGQAVALAADKSGRSERGTLLLTNEPDTGYEDIPLRCTPRFKIMDKAPDEATGVLMDIAPLNTEYNEVFSAFRDMLWRAIYQRYKAKGFTFRNGPRMIPGSGMYALPRADMDISRIEEIINNGPVLEFINKLENMITIIPGLNKYFLGNTPPSETSGEAIGNSIKASITRLEPQRTNIGSDEVWQVSQFFALDEAFGKYKVHGQTVDLAALIENKRRATLTWADVVPQEATKLKQMALAARAAGIISDDTAMDAWSIVSKPDERRKIRKERQDNILHPEHVSQTASAIVQAAQARQHMQAASDLATGKPATPPPQVRISLAAALSPEQTQSAAQMVGIQGAAPMPGTAGSLSIPGRQGTAIPPTPTNAGPAAANESARTAAAQGAPPASEANNQTSPMPDMGALIGTPPPGQTPGGQ